MVIFRLSWAASFLLTKLIPAQRQRKGRTFHDAAGSPCLSAKFGWNLQNLNKARASDSQSLTHFFHELVVVVIAINFPGSVESHDCGEGHLYDCRKECLTHTRRLLLKHIPPLYLIFRSVDANFTSPIWTYLQRFRRAALADDRGLADDTPCKENCATHKKPRSLFTRGRSQLNNSSLNQHSCVRVNKHRIRFNCLFYSSWRLMSSC